jgi:hypothetical protein
MAEPGMARGKQAGHEAFSNGGAGYFHDFPNQQAPDQIEDEDDDEYENDVGSTRTTRIRTSNPNLISVKTPSNPLFATPLHYLSCSPNQE